MRIIFANSISLLFLGLVLHKEKSEVLVVQDKNMVCTKLFNNNYWIINGKNEGVF